MKLSGESLRAREPRFEPKPEINYFFDNKKQKEILIPLIRKTLKNKIIKLFNNNSNSRHDQTNLNIIQ